VRRIGYRDGQPELGGDALEVLVEARQRGDPAVDGLGGLGLGDHAIAKRQDFCDRDREEPRGFLGPAKSHELDEVHDVLAVGALGVRRGAPGDPALEDLGDGLVEVPDLGGDGRRRAADQDRRQLRLRFVHRTASRGQGRFPVLATCPVILRVIHPFKTTSSAAHRPT